MSEEIEIMLEGIEIMSEKHEFSFFTGDIVFYTSGRFGSSLENPLLGSPYECYGQVEEISPETGILNEDESCIIVKWSNGKMNTYSSSDLVIVYDDHMNQNAIADPNLIFKRHNALTTLAGGDEKSDIFYSR